MKYILILVLVASIGVSLFFVSREHSVSYRKEENQNNETMESKPLLFVGDIMMGRFVETLGKRYGNESFMFASTSDYLKRHVTIANLEGPIPNTHEPTPINGFSFSFPSSTPRILKENGITAVSLANNHMFDHGRGAWEETKSALDQAGVAHVGGYAPTESDVFETSLGVQKVVVYGITMIATGWDESQALLVTEKLRKDHPDALLIAFLHWGDEYVSQNEVQRSFAHKLIDRGVDAIVGSHPHVVQGIELYDGKPIFYSLGNFVFDQYWMEGLEDGYALRLNGRTDSYEYDIVPIHSVRSVPSIADSVIRNSILSAIADQSPETIRASIMEGKIRIPAPSH